MKKRASFFSQNRGQIWIETVMYTLIAFVMIGLVLTFAKPKIEELQDKALIDQSIRMLKDMDQIIFLLIQGGPGNQREIELGIKKGELKIDAINDKIIFEMQSSHIYSEPREIVNDGNLIVYTETKGNLNIVNLTSDYSGSYNIKYDGKDELQILTASSVPYKLFLSNDGDIDEYNKIIIDINLI
jgi:hypothetical protein